MKRRYKVVVIGVSAGGLTALSTLLPLLPANFPLPVLIVQHIAPSADDYLARHLGESCVLPVREGGSQQPLQLGVTLAPPGYHLVVSGPDTLDISADERVCWARPSVDVLFESAAQVFGGRVVAVVLTGANNDGASGARAIAAAGGAVIVQDPAGAEVPVMPEAALLAVPRASVLALPDIANTLILLSK